MTLTKILASFKSIQSHSQKTHVFKSRSIIGFDLGLEKLNMVQVDFRSGYPVVHAAASDYHETNFDELLQNPDSFKELVKSSLKSRKFTGRKVVSSVPSHFLKLLFLNYQLGKNENDVESLLSALKRRVNFDLSEFVIDYVPIKPDATERNDRMALVAMAKQDIVEQYLDLLMDCGLEVVALEIGPVAIRRLVNAMSTPEQLKKVLTINFGTNRSYLTVIWNNELIFDRKIDFGIDTIIAVVARAFDVPDKTALQVLHKYGLDEPKQRPAFSIEDDLVDIEDDDNDSGIKNTIYDILNASFVSLAAEIRDIMVYIASETRGGAVEQIYLMGSLARLSGIDNVIDKLITIPVKTLNPFYGIELDDVSNTLYDLGPVAGVAVATGLALRGQQL
jgi:type IV pilus assembly protein PilM